MQEGTRVYRYLFCNINYSGQDCWHFSSCLEADTQALLDRLNKLENEVNDLKLSNNKSNDSELNEIKGKKQKKEKVDKQKRKQSEYN